MQHGSRPVGALQGRALRVGDRDQGELRPARVDSVQVLDVETAVQGGECARGHFLEQREVQHVGVEVQHVKLVHAASDLVQHGQVCGQVGLQRRGVQPDRLVAHGRQARLGGGISAGKQGHVMSEIDQSVAQVGDHSFRTAIEFGRDRFIEGGNLSNLHANRLLGNTAAHAVPQTVRLEPAVGSLSAERTTLPRERR